jgi:hypothetical protein
MPASRNSAASRLSSRRSDRRSAILAAITCFLIAAAVMSAAVWYFFSTGATLYWGDAEAHLDIARRVVDSLTPGWAQLGTTWLPLPHLLMLPLVRYDRLWTTGLAGAVVSAACMSLATAFLFAGVRRLFGSIPSGCAAVAVFLLNPNTLYLGSIPMTEAVFFASLFAVFYFTVRFGQTKGWGALAGAALAACAGALTRYEAWFLLPFIAGFAALQKGPRRIAKTIVFCLIAAAGPVLWLAHNLWYFDDALYFYHGPWSALAIQKGLPYPGEGDWRLASKYFLEAGHLLAGWPAFAIGALGVILAAARRIFWPVVLFALLPAFYIWSIHSKGTPVFIPTLDPHGWYNTRYAMAFLPLIALGAGAIAQFGRIAAFAVATIALCVFLIHPSEHSVTWQEAEHNSEGRREWTAQAVTFLRSAAGPNQTYFSGFGLTSIYRSMGIAFRDTLSGDNNPNFDMACSRPDLFLHSDWAIVRGGDDAQTAVDRARLHGPRYELNERIMVKGEPVVEIYHRVYEYPLR